MLRAAFKSKTPKDGGEKVLRSSGTKEIGDELQDDSLEVTFEQEANSENSSVSLTDSTANNIPNEGKEGEYSDDLGSPISTTSPIKDKDFPYTERDIYEMQLVQLQEQLVATMIEAQEKDEQLQKFSSIDVDKLYKELEHERKRSADLEEKVKILKHKNNNKLYRKNASKADPRSKGSNRHSWHSGAEGEDWVDLGTEQDDSEGAEHNSLPVADSTSGPISGPSDEIQPGESEKQKISKIADYKKIILEMLVDRLWDFVNDEPETDACQEDEGEPLSVKNLKENINRFSNGIRPITSFVKAVNRLVSWSNGTASFMAFMIYMFAARYGYLLSLVLLLCIGKLFMNYLHARGIASQLGFKKKTKEEPPSDDKSWSDKFQLVLQVARRVQDILGKMADSLEKLRNLLTWQHPATKTLFTCLCLAFVGSVFLQGTTLFMFIALFFGIKMFIIRPTYIRFPKVKKRYDGLARTWAELPTDADLLSTVKKEVLSRDSNNSSSTSDVTTNQLQGSQNASSRSFINLCERLKIPTSEAPLPSWEEGRHCFLVDKDKPFTNSKQGKLYLTQSYLCFEKAKSSSSKHITIKLESIVRLSKFKPIGIMPGTGMSIEVEVKNVDKPYIFGAMMGRDEVYDSIMNTAKTTGFPWAT
ncbi:predicted protein [Nematostella vectensis]|uniref:GRAM domain-containing protein n=1 Tax=Nematostella vectensis TaxID=45351 RepID=A7SJE4_NEMVE|nr:predicted protein [Nematostella vectensis]|eukprot:XP_001628208.1 predicted protein [Nematostella vectensis]